MNTTFTLLTAIAANLTMTVWMTICLIHDFTNKQKPVHGVRVFRYFTIDSNVLMAAAALTAAVFEICALTGNAAALPAWMTVLKYVFTCAVALTMLTVLFFLGPTQGYRRMLSGDNLYMHLIGPLLAILTFCFLEHGAPLTLLHTLYATVPTALYGGIYLLLVVILKKLPDFYGFNAGGRWYFSITAMLCASWGINLLIRLLYNSML